MVSNPIDQTSAAFYHSTGMLISWALLCDISIIVTRYMKTFSMKIQYIYIHSLISWLIFFLSNAGAFMIIRENYELNGSLLPSNPIRFMHAIFGFIVIILNLITQTMAIASVLTIKEEIQGNVKNRVKIHSLSGYFLYAFSKLNLIIGVAFYYSLVYKILIYAYLMILIFIHIRLNSWFENYKNNYDKFLTNKHGILKKEHLTLLKGIEDGKTSNEIKKLVPSLKWVIYGNDLYDVTDFFHPGGNDLLSKGVGMEVSRFIFGASTSEISEIDPYNHTGPTTQLLRRYYISEIPNMESILVPKNEAFSIRYSNSTISWELVKIQEISNSTSIFYFTCPSFEVKLFGSSLNWLSRHFLICSKKYPSLRRPYTTALSLTNEHKEIRKLLKNSLGSKSAQDERGFSNLNQRLSSLPLVIKNYSQVRGFSKLLHKSHPKDEFLIEGPMGRGLEMVDPPKENVFFLGAGTGILPFLDFIEVYYLNLLSYELKRLQKNNEVLYITSLGVKIDPQIIEQEIKILASFSSKEDMYGLDLLKDLAELDKSLNRNKVSILISKFSAENFKEINGRIDKNIINQEVGEKKWRFYICGPPKFNRDIPNILKSLGTEEEKIILV